MWGNNDYLWMIGERGSGGGVVNLSGDNDDEMDSWANHSNTNARGYANAGGSGDCQTFGAQSWDNNVAPFNGDEVSAWATNGGC